MHVHTLYILHGGTCSLFQEDFVVCNSLLIHDNISKAIPVMYTQCHEIELSTASTSVTIEVCDVL